MRIYPADIIETAITEYVNSLDSVEVVANKYGIKRASLNYHIKKRGLVKWGNGGGVVVREAVDYFKDNKLSTVAEVSQLFGMTHDVLYRWLNYHGEYENRAHYEYDRSFFSVIDTKEKMYWLGFIFADGMIRSVDYGDDKYVMGVALSCKDADHLDLLREALKYPVELKDVGEDCVGLSVSSKEMVNDLIDKGLTPRKSLTLEYPTWVIGHLLEKYFIIGFFDGNGCITMYTPKGCKKPKIVFDIASTLDVVENIGNYFNRILGVNPSIYPIGKIHVYRKAWNKALTILDHLYSEDTICLNRKRQIYKDYCRLYRCSK